MRIFLKVVFFALSACFIFYLLLPTKPFPSPPVDSFQSQEEGDSEVLSIRRAYFTNYTREQVITHYKSQFGRSGMFGLILPTLRLNYPPEDSQTLIRDQTKSTFLEELVHPFRESMYINGYEPKEAQNEIWYKGIHYRQKIIIKYSTSNVLVRLTIATLVIIAGFILLHEYSDLFRRQNQNKKSHQN